MSATLPKTVPVLTGKDICRERFHGEGGTHCLIGWFNTCFKSLPLKDRSEPWAQLRSSAGGSLIELNDDPLNPKSKVAAVWNRAMHAIGYRKHGNKFVLPNGGAA